ncbi:MULTISPECIES: FecCD family ABC transporter permease [Prauserella salsuginis group]|uniref:FecCD family ABC transporter permease n=1 Tax=Prauserella salsuginis TaxID=387889 RepID=A0ABW6G7N9_9PSEU|nr:MULTISPECIES: iron ABC transporter permease [Prauserella salsuginis group]MCR3719576.1 iron complex transport system permease protein [Prauserella flava]MCR3735410.1 iron complex transport system permease protein [Prauserella salsuginis]
MNATLAAEPAPAGRRALHRRRTRRLLSLAALAGALVVAAAASLAYGAHPVPLEAVWQALVAPAGGEDDIIVRSLRVPRTVLGILAGLALGAGGALMQGHTRNPLADPGLLGVNQGAALGVVTAVVVFDVTALGGYIWFGFAGALIAAVLVFVLGTVRGGATPVTLALAGAAVSALLYGLISAIVLSDRQGMDTYRFWHVGSIAGRELAVAGQLAPFLIAGFVLALANTPGLNSLALGEDVSTALGRHVGRTRLLGIAAITLLVGAAVSACGPIAFVGLLVPHMARVVTGPDYRWLVPCAALLGAVLVLLADVLGRLVAGDTLEVGILLAAVGAPGFIYLVRRRGLSKI